MSSFASGVTVVTTAYEGQLSGLTVSSFASLSADPQLVLICIDKGVNSHAIISAAGAFAVNILAQGQEQISTHFASRNSDKFAGVAYRLGAAGLPLLDGALAYAECRVVSELAGGDHTIFVGEVTDGDVAEGHPLLYFKRGYHGLA